MILHAWGRLEEALGLHKEAERLCRELGNPEGLATSLANQARLLHQGTKRPQESSPLAEQANRLATEYGYARLAQQIKPILDQVRLKVG